MFINGLLIVLLVICIVLVVNYVRKRMDKADFMLSRRREVSSLIVNCNNYKPIGDVFSNLQNLLEENQESNYIEYRGHF